MRKKLTIVGFATVETAKELLVVLPDDVLGDPEKIKAWMRERKAWAGPFGVELCDCCARRLVAGEVERFVVLDGEGDVLVDETDIEEVR